MIKIYREKIVTVEEAIGIFPRRKNGNRLSRQTLWRWMKEGRKGIKLESIVMGGRRCTSAEAIQRFCEALTLQTQAKDEPGPAVGAEAAIRELKEKGWI